MMDVYLENRQFDQNIEKSYWWVFGGKGGYSRCQIMELLLDRPYNAYQISKKLEKSYNNIKYHLRVLKREFMVKNDGRTYSSFHYICKDFNIEIFGKIFQLINENEKYQKKRTKFRTFKRKLESI